MMMWGRKIEKMRNVIQDYLNKYITILRRENSYEKKKVQVKDCTQADSHLPSPPTETDDDDDDEKKPKGNSSRRTEFDSRKDENVKSVSIEMGRRGCGGFISVIRRKKNSDHMRKG